MPMHSFKPVSQNNAPPIVPMRPIPPAPPREQLPDRRRPIISTILEFELSNDARKSPRR